jgi:hypothetical protein
MRISMNLGSSLRFRLAAAAVVAAGTVGVPSDTYRVNCGEHRTIALVSGVQRANGSYNYGQAARVTTP